MTTATKKPTTPRSRKRKVDDVTSVDKPPVCAGCGTLLSERDTAYGAASSHRCKGCKAKAEQATLRGTPVPDERMPHAPMAYGSERTRKMTVRPPRTRGHAPREAADVDHRQPWKHPPKKRGAA